jgi:hypothetical protein
MPNIAAVVARLALVVMLSHATATAPTWEIPVNTPTRYVQNTRPTVVELASVRHPHDMAQILEHAGIVTMDDLCILDAEDLDELKLDMRNGGAALSDRAKIRELWEINRANYRPVHLASPQAKTSVAASERKRNLQEQGATGADGGMSGE